MHILAEAIRDGIVVLDGGLATRLEERGHDLSSALWSARLLREDPEEIVAAHRDYFAAGARVAITASYQASFDGFAAAGVDRAETARLLTRSVRLADRARQESTRRCWVAASVGPYGAALADGSEYRGDYDLSVAQLRAWHRPRLQVLAEAGADVLALETIPCLAEAEALLAEVSGLGLPVWLSMTAEGGRTRAGEPIAEAFAMAADVDEVIAAGVNCCAATQVAELTTIAATASGKPVVAYPNSGESWDADNRCWAGDPTFTPESVNDWVGAGARLIGGCCRVGPDQIRALSAAVNGPHVAGS